MAGTEKRSSTEPRNICSAISVLSLNIPPRLKHRRLPNPHPRRINQLPHHRILNQKPPPVLPHPHPTIIPNKPPVPHRRQQPLPLPLLRRFSRKPRGQPHKLPPRIPKTFLRRRIRVNESRISRPIMCQQTKRRLPIQPRRIHPRSQSPAHQPLETPRQQCRKPFIQAQIIHHGATNNPGPLPCQATPPAHPSTPGTSPAYSGRNAW